MWIYPIYFTGGWSISMLDFPEKLPLFDDSIDKSCRYWTNEQTTATIKTSLIKNLWKYLSNGENFAIWLVCKIWTSRGILFLSNQIQFFEEVFFFNFSVCVWVFIVFDFFSLSKSFKIHSKFIDEKWLNFFRFKGSNTWKKN